MLDWRDEMMLDNASLDTEHRRQHELIRQFVGLPREDSERERALELLGELRTVSGRHFAQEERVQAATHFPHLEEHRAQHRRLTDILDEIISQVEARESVFTFGYLKGKADELLQFWFFDHFVKADLQLKTHLTKLGMR